MRIGLVSDNHALVDPALGPLLEGVDEIWHAGDLVTAELLGVLAAIAPVLAVRGNNDLAAGLAGLPEERVFEREGWRVLLRHIVGPPGRVDGAAQRTLAREEPEIVVMGHSHRPLAESGHGRLHLNPGSCGPRRFRLPRSAGLLVLAPETALVRIVDLESGRDLLEKSFSRRDLRE